MFFLTSLCFVRLLDFFFPFLNFKLLTLSNTVIPAVVSTIVENKKQRYFCYGKCYSTEEARLR